MSICVVQTSHNPNDSVLGSSCERRQIAADPKRDARAAQEMVHSLPRKGVVMSAVIVLNTDNTALHTVSIKHAILMLVREVAIVEEARDGHRIGPYPWPLVLRLIRYVKTTFLYARTPAWSKRGVLRRDHHRCAYCEGPADTVDHLLPQSRGGTNSWQNTVAACTRCNNRKANRTPAEAGMWLAWKPGVPTWRDVYHRRN
jgi:HNH endonuclease